METNGTRSQGCGLSIWKQMAKVEIREKETDLKQLSMQQYPHMQHIV